MAWDGWIGLSWGLSVLLLAAVATYALVIAWRWRARVDSTEAFITARHSIPAWRIGWSFFAGAVGSWVISSTSSYAASAGLVGLSMYAFATGLPFFIIACAGPVIDRHLPRALSLAEYTGWRFGVVAQIGITSLTVFNMSIFMLAEFITMGTLFEVYVGSVGYPIIVAVGLLTLTYTTFGGLLVSVATDQIQGIVSVVLLLVITIYLGVTFDMPLPPMTDVVAGNTLVGLSSIFTMPASICAGAVFNESLWQRAFAAKNRRTLWIGATLGAIGSIVMVFICGLCGWLAVWADPDTVLAANSNLYMFYGLKGTVDVATGTMNNTMGLVVLLLAVVMDEGAIDSLQNGLLASFSSFTALGIRYYRRDHPGKLPVGYQLPLLYTRLLVVLINVPLIVLGSVGCSQGWSIMDLYLVTGMLCCTVAIPVLFGISSRFRDIYGGGSFLLSWISGFLCPSLYGIFKDCWHSDLVFDATLFAWQCVPNGRGEGGGAAGMAFAWFRNGYRWEYFLLALGCSTGAMVVCMAVNWLLLRCGVQTPSLPGFRPFYLEEDEGIPEDSLSVSLTDKEGTCSLPREKSEVDYFDYPLPPTSTPELTDPHPSWRPSAGSTPEGRSVTHPRPVYPVY